MIVNKYRSGITGEQIDEWTVKCLFDAVGKGGIDLLEQNGYIVKSGIYQYETYEEMIERCSWQELAEKHCFMSAIKKYRSLNPEVSIGEAKKIIDKYWEDTCNKFKTGVKMKGWDE